MQSEQLETVHGFWKVFPVLTLCLWLASSHGGNSWNADLMAGAGVATLGYERGTIVKDDGTRDKELGFLMVPKLP